MSETDPNAAWQGAPRATARNYSDIACGVLLGLVGAVVALYAVTHHDLGTFSQMGTGMFPMALGLILILLGVLIILPALFQPGEIKSIDARPILAVIAALGAFPLMLSRFGFLPAVAATVILSTFAEDRIGIWGRLVLTVAICALTYVIFIIGFRLPVMPFRMPL